MEYNVSNYLDTHETSQESLNIYFGQSSLRHRQSQDYSISAKQSKKSLSVNGNPLSDHQEEEEEPREDEKLEEIEPEIQTKPEPKPIPTPYLGRVFITESTDLANFIIKSQFEIHNRQHWDFEIEEFLKQTFSNPYEIHHHYLQVDSPIKKFEHYNIGFLGLTFDYSLNSFSSNPFILDCFIEPWWRKNGFFKTFINLLIKEVKRGGCSGKIRLLVRKRSADLRAILTHFEFFPKMVEIFEADLVYSFDTLNYDSERIEKNLKLYKELFGNAPVREFKDFEIDLFRLKRDQRSKENFEKYLNPETEWGLLEQVFGGEDLPANSRIQLLNDDDSDSEDDSQPSLIKGVMRFLSSEIASAQIYFIRQKTGSSFDQAKVIGLFTAFYEFSTIRNGYVLNITDMRIIRPEIEKIGHIVKLVNMQLLKHRKMYGVQALRYWIEHGNRYRIRDVLVAQRFDLTDLVLLEKEVFMTDLEIKDWNEERVYASLKRYSENMKMGLGK